MNLRKNKLFWLLVAFFVPVAVAWWRRQEQVRRGRPWTSHPAEPSTGRVSPGYELATRPETQPLARKQRRTVTVVTAPETARPGTDPEPEIERMPAAMADFNSLEGIDESVSQLLYSAGITSFEELAGTDLDRLAEILYDAGLPEVDPLTWPRQARLIVQGRWNDLAALQNDIQAGQPPTTALDIEA